MSFLPHTRPPLLIVLCAGPTSLHHHGKHPWLSPSARTSPERRYDVAVLHYGNGNSNSNSNHDSSDTHPYAPHTVHFEHTQGPKWSLLRTFLRQHRALWQAYTYVAFPDDDLEMSPSDWNQLVDIAGTHQLDVFQPAVVPPASDPGAPLSKYIRHTHVMPAVRDGFVDILRFVDMVEIMVPVFRGGALAVCVDGMGSSGQPKSTSSTTRKRSRHSGGRGKWRRPRHRTTRNPHHTRHPHHHTPTNPTHKKRPRPLPTTGILMDPNLRSGWGIDYALPQTVLPCHRFDLPPTHPDNTSRKTYRYAIVDQVVIEHTRPLGNVDGKTLRSSFYRTFNINPEREMRDVLRTWRARTRPPRTLRHVPVPVDYAYVERDATAEVPPPYNKLPARRVAYDTIRLPTFLESNLNRERLAVQQRKRYNAATATATATAPTTATPTDWSAYYYKLGYGFHARIRNNQLTVLHDLGSFQSRNWNTVQMLHEVLRRYTFKGIDVEILVCTDDKLRTPDHVDTAGVPILVMAKTPGQTYVTYPDHTFYCWKEARTRSWERERADIARASSLREREKRRPVAFFRGNLNTSSVRKVLGKARRAELDVKGVDVGSSDTATTTTTGTFTTTDTFTTLADHTAYKYLLHIPGRSYAARLKYLMATGSDVIYVQPSPAQEYREFWYDGLEPGVNCWVVRGGKTGAGDVVDGVVGVVKEAEEVERGREHQPKPKEDVRGAPGGLRGAGEVVRELEWGGYWGRVIAWL